MIRSSFMVQGQGEKKHWILMIHIMMDNKRQDQTFTSRSNIYVSDNHGRDIYLLRVNALVILEIFLCTVQIIGNSQQPMTAA